MLALQRLWERRAHVLGPPGGYERRRSAQDLTEIQAESKRHYATTMTVLESGRRLRDEHKRIHSFFDEIAPIEFKPPGAVNEEEKS